MTQIAELATTSRLDALREELQHNIENGDTCLASDLRRVDRRHVERERELTQMFQEMISATNQLATALRRASNQLELLQRRTAELEARTWPARLKRFRSWWRALVAELGGRWTYTDDELTAQDLDALRKLYAHPNEVTQ